MTHKGFQCNNSIEAVIIDKLLMAKANAARVRIFYGNRETGEDYCEEFGTMGYVGKSTGKLPILLLVPRSDSLGGEGILLSQVIRITIDKQNIYQCANYQLPEFRIRQVANFKWVYRHDTATGKWVKTARFEDRRKAEQFIKFMRGESNRK